MEKNSKTEKNFTATRNHVKFEDTYEGQLLLNSISAALHIVRKENQYLGEIKIMQNLTKKAYFTQDQQSEVKIADLMKKKDARKSRQSEDQNLLPHIYRNAGFIRTNMPKNQ